MNLPAMKKKPTENMSMPGGVGDKIRFSRKGMTIDGIIRIVKENVAIVEITLEDSLSLQLDNQWTVVAHKNYMIMKKRG